MKIAWDTQLKDLEDKPLKQVEKPFTLGMVAIQALNQLQQEDNAMTGQQRYELGKLAYKISKTPDEDFDIDELKQIRERIGKLFAPFIVMQSYDILQV